MKNKKGVSLIDVFIGFASGVIGACFAILLGYGCVFTWQYWAISIPVMTVFVALFQYIRYLIALNKK